MELDGNAAEAPPPPLPMGGGEPNAEDMPDPPPLVGPWPFAGPFAAALADWTFPKALVPDPASAAADIATVAVPAARPTPTDAKSPPVIAVVPPRIAEANLGDIQQTARNITAAAARSKPVLDGSGEVLIELAIAPHPWDRVIPAPTRR